MNYYSDPTASRALGNINREFTRFQKRAKKIRALLLAGEITPKQAMSACQTFPVLYRQLLWKFITKPQEEPSADSSAEGQIYSST